mmetsp:Transcript_24296/g.72125  ORF Transcript_24296/g.72125 Transcript_24296/m.72125 type:complete len:200 (-) Transcript_24296:1852-2451(-)
MRLHCACILRGLCTTFTLPSSILGQSLSANHMQLAQQVSCFHRHCLDIASSLYVRLGIAVLGHVTEQHAVEKARLLRTCHPQNAAFLSSCSIIPRQRKSVADMQCLVWLCACIQHERLQAKALVANVDKHVIAAVARTEWHAALRNLHLQRQRNVLEHLVDCVHSRHNAHSVRLAHKFAWQLVSSNTLGEHVCRHVKQA